MNELQQVLLIFAVVVIAGLYFLSRSRQSKSSDKNESKHNQNHSVAKTASENESEIEHTLNTQVLEKNNTAINPQKKKASEALKELGTPHIPLSSSTEERLTQTVNTAQADYKVTQPIEKTSEQQVAVKTTPENIASNDNTNTTESIQTEDIVTSHPNQGQLFFGDEFDIPQEEKAVSSSSADEIKTESTPEINKVAVETEQNQNLENDSNGSIKPNEQAPKAKHHVLVVDDPGMTGEVEPEMLAPEEIKPSFGIPEDPTEIKGKIYASTNKKPEVFVLLVMSTGQEFAMTEVNQALYGVGLTLSEQSIFVKKDNMGNAFIKVANMLEPGTFPVENLGDFNTPGVAMILELPTTVRAPAAMHDLIMMARKVSQRLNGRLYNMERHLIKESDLQSMRDAALDYESEPL